jgi:dTDP-4-dehydrorhamnose reductase
MTVLLIGAGGILGNALLQTAPEGIQVEGTTRALLDLRTTSPASLLESVRPSAVIYAAALTDVDGCEKNPDVALCVHVAGVAQCRAYCERTQTPFIYISTSYVFDGKEGGYKETDTPIPINTYARTKFLGEQQTQRFLSPTLVLRVNHFHHSRNGSLLWPFHALDTPLQAYEDMIFSALFAQDCAKIIWELITRKITGLYHVGTQDAYSRKRFVEMILQQAHLSQIVHAIPCPLQNRPLDTSLDVSALRRLGIEPLSSEQTIHNLVVSFLRER